MTDYVIGNPEILNPAFRSASNLDSLREMAKEQGMSAGPLQLEDRGVTDQKFDGGAIKEQGITIRDRNGAEMDCGVTTGGVHCGPVKRRVSPSV